MRGVEFDGSVAIGPSFSLLTALAWAPVWRILYDDGSGEREVTLPAYVRPGP